MQNVVLVIEWLGVFVYDWWNEGLYGVVWVGQVMVFLQVIGLVVIFDVLLMGQVVMIISDEVCVKYYQFFCEGVYGCYQGLIFWLLNVNIFCDLCWGRGQEIYGEDFYFIVCMGVVFVCGLQGDDFVYWKLDVIVKYLVVYSGLEVDCYYFDVWFSWCDLYDIYLLVFEVLVKEGEVDVVMGVYNCVYGEFVSVSCFLLCDVL